MQKILLAIITSAVVLATLSFFGTLPALANPSPSQGTNMSPSGHVTGQPGAPTTTCNTGSVGGGPGGSANAAGSPFNPNGGLPNGGGAGNNYAGNPGTASLAHSGSPGTAISQYDTACFQQSVR